MFSRGFTHVFMRHSAQPVMFNHSSRGLGHDLNKQLVSVGTDALLAKMYV